MNPRPWSSSSAIIPAPWTAKPTELIGSQHVLIYSWLLYQYAMQVESRFILHDTEAKEVPDFYTYYNSRWPAVQRLPLLISL